jgi:L-alanine-DL-glutamate epimerase-like enolase superfamily enzyme
VLYRHLLDWQKAEGINVLIADGEGLASPRLLDWAEQGLINVVQYDLRDIGFTRWLHLGKQLDAWFVKSAPHNYGSNFGNYASCHLASVIGNFAFVEWDHADTPGLSARGYALREGYVSVPDTPGWGLYLDDAIFTQAVQQGGFETSL